LPGGQQTSTTSRRGRNFELFKSPQPTLANLPNDLTIGLSKNFFSASRRKKPVKALRLKKKVHQLPMDTIDFTNIQKESSHNFLADSVVDLGSLPSVMETPN